MANTEIARADTDSPSPWLGLPSLPATAQSAQSSDKLRQLGEALFFDARLSSTGDISCSSCHQPSHAFTDGQPQAVGRQGLVGTRNTPSLLNVVFYAPLFWDGRRDTLEAQALDPLINPLEHGLMNMDTVLTIVERDPAYRRAFGDAFDDEVHPVRIERIAQALATYERSLFAGNSAFDRFRYGGEENALSESAQRGLALFEGRGQCASCHTIGEKHALFTDNSFHSLAVGLSRISKNLANLTQAVVQQRAAGHSLDHTVMNDADIAELGRFVVTLKPEDIGAFRTPSLRNVALTAPYMHDGSIATLEEAVDLELYYRGARDGQPLILSLIEKADLVAFLKSLSSPSALASDTSAAGAAHIQ